MKSSSSPPAKSAPPKKTVKAHSLQSRRSDSSPSLVSASSLQPEAIPPTKFEPSVCQAAGSRRGVRFGYFKPEARQVYLVGAFNSWDPRATPLSRDSLGDWSIEIELPTGEHRYRFVVDGEWRDDPTAQQTEKNPFGGFDSIMVVV